VKYKFFGSLDNTPTAKIGDGFFHLRVALLFFFEFFTKSSVDSFLNVALIHESCDDFRFRLRDCALSFHYMLYTHIFLGRHLVLDVPRGQDAHADDDEVGHELVLLGDEGHDDVIHGSNPRGFFRDARDEDGYR